VEAEAGGGSVKEIGRYFKRGLALFPGDKAARELHAKIKEGAWVFIEVWLPRNMAQHRKYFAVLNNVVEATGEWTSTEDLRFEIFKALKRGLLRVSQVDGSVDFIPDSMAVASMPKAEFERLYEDTMKWLTDRYGCDPEMLTQEAA
jgi:hypothetical protein